MQNDIHVHVMTSGFFAAKLEQDFDPNFTIQYAPISYPFSNFSSHVGESYSDLYRVLECLRARLDVLAHSCKRQNGRQAVR